MSSCEVVRERICIYVPYPGAKGSILLLFFFRLCGVQKKAEAFDGLKEEDEAGELSYEKMETEGRFPKSLMADGRFCLFGKAVRRRGR